MSSTGIPIAVVREILADRNKEARTREPLVILHDLRATVHVQTDRVTEEIDDEETHARVVAQVAETREATVAPEIGEGQRPLVEHVDEAAGTRADGTVGVPVRVCRRAWVGTGWTRPRSAAQRLSPL